MLTEQDGNRLLKEAKEHLINIVRIDTTNPPGNETQACEYIKEVLQGEKIDSEIIESAPGRGNLIARLEGDGSKKPLLVAGHLDVVPANAADWSVDPFSGEERDGCIWGRGTMDMKHTVVMDLVALLELKRQCVKLKRDVIFCAEADEEQSGNFGMGYLVEKCFEKIDCEYALNEGGGLAIDVEGTNVYFCQNAEKGVNWIKLVTRGEPGHGSVPRGDNALVKMANTLKTAARPLPMRRTKIVEEMVKGMAEALNFPKNLAFRHMLNPLLTGPILSAISSQDPTLGDTISALLRDTVSPTTIRAGYKENVIPEKCEAVIDCRILPGITSKEFVAKMQRRLREAEVELMDLPVPDPTESPLNTELHEAIIRFVQKKDPGSVVVPLLMPGATDNRFLREKGITAYGFSPMKSKTHSLKELMEKVHGIDERVPLDALEFGTVGTYELLADFCG